MLCQICKKKPASIQLQEFTGTGEKKIIMLCTDCAQKKSVLSSLFDSAGFILPDTIQNLAQSIKDAIANTLKNHDFSDQNFMISGGIPMNFPSDEKNTKDKDSPSRKIRKVKECHCCGWTEEKIQNTGKLGCPECYTAFGNRILSDFDFIHHKQKHEGLTQPDPLNVLNQETAALSQAEEEFYKEKKLAMLRKGLSEIVRREEYELAAALRDEIKGIEDELSEGKH